jgi:hypothetical protein
MRAASARPVSDPTVRPHNPLISRTAKSARTKRSLTLLGVLAALAAIAIAASAGPSAPAPVIVSGPSGATNATSATFSFSGVRGDTFECALDGAAFTACTSPKSYAGPLAPGGHTFQVRARTRAGQLSAAASRSWTIDTQAPPAPQLVQAPPSPSGSDDATFQFADAEANVTYLCRLDGGAWAGCGSPVTFRSLADGAHALAVRARDAAGNLGPASSHAWQVDTVAPPAPVLLQHPDDPAPSNSATFAFDDAEAGVTFACRLDGGDWETCASPTTYTDLDRGRRHFEVLAVDAAGNRSAATGYAWRIAPAQGALPFTASGDLPGTLFPGASGTLALTVHNPNGKTLYVTSLTVTVQPGSTRAGCDGPANLDVTQSDASEANPLVIPANESVTLPAGGVSAPQVLMRNLPTNQDACKGATFAFAYGGSAHS